MSKDVKPSVCKVPSKNSADCPANCWIEFHVVDESGQAVSGITALFIDSAGKKYDVNFAGTPVILNSVTPGKGRLIFSSLVLYDKSSYAVRGQTNNPAKQNQVSYKKYPPSEKQIAWRGPLMKDVTNPIENGREIGDLVSKNSYEFILQTHYLEEIIVVGAQHDDNPGNKLMFAGQAVRALYHSKDKSHSKVVLMFTQQYTAAQITLVKNAVAMAGAKFKEITSLADCLEYINKRNEDDRWKYLIISLRFYSHGLASQIYFGYSIDASLNLTLKNLNQIEQAAFSPSQSTTIYSYACRTGLGPAGTRDPLRNVDVPDDRSNSLAQKMANHLRVPVWGYIRRSDYANTWSTPKDTDFLIDYGKRLSWKEKLKDWSDWSEDDLTESDKKRLNQLQSNMDEWNKNKENVGALFLKKGAMHDVKAGESNSFHTPNYVKFSPE